MTAYHQNRRIASAGIVAACQTGNTSTGKAAPIGLRPITHEGPDFGVA